MVAKLSEAILKKISKGGLVKVTEDVAKHYDLAMKEIDKMGPNWGLIYHPYFSKVNTVSFILGALTTATIMFVKRNSNEEKIKDEIN